MLLTFLFIIAAIVLYVYLFMKRPQFGRLASGERLKLIQSSPNYKDGQFQNLSITPALTEGATYYGVMKEFFFGKKQTWETCNATSIKNC